ncbi:hypothetical protein HZA99_05985 [Candidatus Woesearchaeota archaeon]|nr:hypothetical protein [Candidatus Woesearchaeota archaeon]
MDDEKMGIVGNFYQTNFKNGEFGKHKWAYALLFAAGAVTVKYDLPAKMHDTYSTLEHKVDVVYHALQK